MVSNKTFASSVCPEIIVFIWENIVTTGAEFFQTVIGPQKNLDLFYADSTGKLNFENFIKKNE